MNKGEYVIQILLYIYIYNTYINIIINIKLQTMNIKYKIILNILYYHNISLCY